MTAAADEDDFDFETPPPKSRAESHVYSKDALAPMIGESPRGIDRMVRAGCPVIRDGKVRSALKFNLPEVVAWMVAQARPADDSLDEAKRRERIAIAREREVKTGILTGEAVMFADVIKEIRSNVATLRTGLLALSSRIDAPPELKAAIDREVTALINAMSIQRQFGDGHDARTK